MKLTDEKRKLAAKYIPLACRRTREYLQTKIPRFELARMHVNDEVLCIAHQALIKAARRFNPKISQFPNYLKWAVTSEAASRVRVGDNYRKKIEAFAKAKAPKAETSWRHNTITDDIDVERLMKILPDSEKTVVEKRLFEDQTFKSIAREMGKSKQRVHQIYQNGINRMRQRVLTA